MRLDQFGLLVAVNAAQAAILPARQAIVVTATVTDSSMTSPSAPRCFQTSPEIHAGPTAIGRAPFLAQSNPVFFASSASFLPNAPLETGEPISGQGTNRSIFELMNNLSPYFPNPSGFGVAEYPLPTSADIIQVQMLSRHGYRCPTTGSSQANFGQKIANATGKFNATGPLAFLNSWKYGLGAEIIVPYGRKIIARTTTQDRMLKSAEYFMAGFFGLQWTNNATLEVIIEQNGFKNTLAGYFQCDNSNLAVSAGGPNASALWVSTYLKDATARFQGSIMGYNFTTSDVYSMQGLCPYKTVVFGYSAFCDLFTHQEWIDFEYSIDISFAGGYDFQSPTGRAVGIGYEQEVNARLRNHTLGYLASQINTTLDNNTVTFPLNQSLYFDFSHDINIMAVLTAFGFTQFNQLLPDNMYPGVHNLTASYMEPFGARLDIEVITMPSPLAANRTYICGNSTTHVHFILNQRTLPLGFSFPECDSTRLDGWCELQTFLDVQTGITPLANYDCACFGDYPATLYGSITNGAPISQ